MQFVIISGMSGAGKSKAASDLEDLGFYCVDNMPAEMIPQFAQLCLATKGRYEKVALVTDVRASMTFDALFQALQKLDEMHLQYSIYYIEASTEVIIKRYKETRRLHPLMKDGSTLADAIGRERELLAPVRNRASAIIDTSILSTGKLRGILIDLVAGGMREHSMDVRVVSFGFKYGLPLEADLVFDVRFLPNPYYIPELKHQTGLDEPVRNFVFKYQQTLDFTAKVEDLLSFLLPNYLDEGKTDLVIAVGCTGGKHRSVCLEKGLRRHAQPPRYGQKVSAMAELTEQIRLYEPHRRQPRIAAIGGGHGLSAMLRGLKTYTKNITAIVTVADDGGGSGMLREDLGMLPPGDIRNCIMALANTEPTMQQLLNYRFTDGSLAGQSFGNLFLAAMNGISGSFDEAVHRMGDVLAITGRVLPVTNQDVRLEAEFHDGSRVLGESKIFYAKKINNSRIRKVRLVPERPAALPESVQAIRDADIVVIGPGSLYTSIIPNFLVSGISDAVRQSRACKIYALNIMTQDGETDGYDADDHVRAILEHAGPGVIDVCIANSTPVPPEIMEPYAKEGVAQLELNRTDIEQLGIAVRTFPLLEPGRYIRHNSDALARAILSVWQEFRKK